MTPQMLYAIAGLLFLIGVVVWAVSLYTIPAGTLVFFACFVAGGFLVVFSMIFGPQPKPGRNQDR